jgi:prepilin-type N-terminal cleavage/methylation domain-containing protein
MSKGFTIVEAMIAVTILGILATVGYSVINPAAVRRNSEDTIRLTNLQKLVEGLEGYGQVQRRFPTDPNSDGDPTNDAVNTNISQFIADWPDGRPTATTEYNYYFDAANNVFGVIVSRSDGRVYKYRSSITWGKRVRECASTAVVTNDLCP